MSNSDRDKSIKQDIIIAASDLTYAREMVQKRECELAWKLIPEERKLIEKNRDHWKETAEQADRRVDRLIGEIRDER